MRAFDAVIVDWSGTLVHDPPLRERVVAAGARLGIDDELAESLLHVDEDPGFRPLYPDALQAHRVIMVGDRSTHDGAAAECGLVTLLLPRLPAYGLRGLSLVESLVRG